MKTIFHPPQAKAIPGLSGLEQTPRVKSSRRLSLSPEQRREKEVQRRRALLESYAALRAKGLTAIDAAKEVGVSEQSLWRWIRRIAPNTARCGRRSVASQFRIEESILEKVEQLQIAGMKAESAWRSIAGECDAKLGEFLRTSKTIPPSLLELTKLRRGKVLFVEGRHFGVIFYAH